MTLTFANLIDSNERNGLFTEQQARRLAKRSRGYHAKKMHGDLWVVWCNASDHHVEFDAKTVVAAR
jgi:hypothetical protein